LPGLVTSPPTPQGGAFFCWHSDNSGRRCYKRPRSGSVSRQRSGTPPTRNGPAAWRKGLLAPFVTSSVRSRMLLPPRPFLEKSWRMDACLSIENRFGRSCTLARPHSAGLAVNRRFCGFALHLQALTSTSGCDGTRQRTKKNRSKAFAVSRHASFGRLSASAFRSPEYDGCIRRQF